MIGLAFRWTLSWWQMKLGSMSGMSYGIQVNTSIFEIKNSINSVLSVLDKDELLKKNLSGFFSSTLPQPSPPLPSVLLPCQHP